MATKLPPSSSTIRILHRKPARLHTLKLHTHTTQKIFMRWLLIISDSKLLDILFFFFIDFSLSFSIFADVDLLALGINLGSCKA